MPDTAQSQTRTIAIKAMLAAIGSSSCPSWHVCVSTFGDPGLWRLDVLENLSRLSVYARLGSRGEYLHSMNLFVFDFLSFVACAWDSAHKVCAFSFSLRTDEENDDLEVDMVFGCLC